MVFSIFWLRLIFWLREWNIFNEMVNDGKMSRAIRKLQSRRREHVAAVAPPPQRIFGPWRRRAGHCATSAGRTASVEVQGEVVGNRSHAVAARQAA